MSERTDEERERARREREARRAARRPAQADGDGADRNPPRIDSPPAPQPRAAQPRMDAPRQPRVEPPAQPRMAPPARPAPEPPARPAPEPPQQQVTEPPAQPHMDPPPQRPHRRLPSDRPHVRDRVEAALARSHARRKERPVVAPGANGSGEATERTRRRRGRFLAPIAIVLLLIAAGAAWFLVSLYQPGKGAGSGRVAVVIPRGGSLGQIATKLGSAGVISHPFFFKLRVRLEGHAGDLKPGSYVLQKDMPYSDVITKLTAGPPNHFVNVTITEGRSRGEIAPLVRQAGLKGSYLRASLRSTQLNPRTFGARHPTSLEGFLFPATYQLKPGSSARTLVNKQLQAFKQNFAKVNMAYARKKNLTPYDVITIASMVEREATLARERPLIAAVIYNRLKQGIPLGIDATIRFAVNNWTRPLLVSQLNVNSPYNTRTHQGLPPGPIGNPGLASLEAAARPAHVNFLFYVVKPCGNGAHAFSSTDAQFQRDVARYNAARAQKGGKSPEKC